MDRAEPLQVRFARSLRVASVCLHVASAAQFIFGCYYDWFHVDVPDEVMPIYSAFGYKFKFLTYWDACLQAFYFSICVVEDLTRCIRQSDTSSSPLRRFKDFLQTSLAFPIAMFVGVTFWGLMAVDRELVLPSKLDPYFPSWLNHIMHTNVVLCQILETATSPRALPSHAAAVPALLVFQSAYIAWMFVVHAKSGLWVYPVFDVLSVPLRVLFLSGCFVGGLAFYFVGHKFNSILWGERGKATSHPSVAYSR